MAVLRNLLRDFVHFFFVVQGLFSDIVRIGEFFDCRSELGRGEALNLRVMIEDEHTNCRDKKKNENAPDAVPDMAKEFAASRRAGFPLSVNSNPFVF